MSSNLDTSVLEDDFDEEPVDDSYGSLGEFRLVGHGCCSHTIAALMRK